MLDISTIDPSLVRLTSVPITTELLTEGFTNPDIAYHLDYASSALRGKSFMVWVGNMNIPSDIKLDDTTPKAERFDLIREWMNSRILIKSNTMALTVCAILTAAKGIDMFYDAMINPILSKQEVIEFIEENLVLVNKWRVVMDSMVVYALSINTKYVAQFGHPQDIIHNVDADDAIGNNFVLLFDQQFFLELFYSAPGEEFHYFVKQFQDYMFEQRNLFSYFMQPSNPLPMIIDTMGSDTYEFADIDKVIKQISALGAE